MIPRSTGSTIAHFFVCAAGPHRTVELNRDLAVLLALIAGALNSVGFVAVSIYTSHMTGLLASVADHLTLGSFTAAGLGAVAIGSFTAGAALCAVLFNWGRRRNLHGRYANVLALEATLILIFGALAGQVTWHIRDWIYIPVLCFTMGLQNAIITKISGAQIRTTHVTGMVTDIGIELGKLAYRNRLPGARPVKGDTTKLATLSRLVAAFFLGSILGAAGYLTIGFPILILPALALLAVAAPPLITDLRRHHSRAEPPTV